MRAKPLAGLEGQVGIPIRFSDAVWPGAVGDGRDRPWRLGSGRRGMAVGGVKTQG